MVEVFFFGKAYQTDTLYKTIIPQTPGVLLPGPKAIADITELLKLWHSNQRQEQIWGYAYRDFFPESWDWSWLPEGGKKVIIEDDKLSRPIVLQGTLPKRIMKFYKDAYGANLPSDLISKIGNAIKLDDPSLKDAHWDITPSFDWKDGDFGDKGSCFWGSDRGRARNHIRDNGGFALRFYKDANRNNKNGFARAFIIPHRLKDGTETWLITNGYGLNTQNICRFFATETQHPYKLIDLTVDGTWSGTVYINAGGRGYILGPEEKIAKISKVNLQWNTHESNSSSYYSSSHDGTYCASCREEVDPDVARYRDNEYWCDNCYWNRYSICADCHQDIIYDRLTLVQPTGLRVCHSCLNAHYHQSPITGIFALRDNFVEVTMRNGVGDSRVWYTPEDLVNPEFIRIYTRLTYPASERTVYATRNQTVEVRDNNGVVHTMHRYHVDDFHQSNRTRPDTIVSSGTAGDYQIQFRNSTPYIIDNNDQITTLEPAGLGLYNVHNMLSRIELNEVPEVFDRTDLVRDVERAIADGFTTLYNSASLIGVPPEDVLLADIPDLNEFDSEYEFDDESDGDDDE